MQTILQKRLQTHHRFDPSEELLLALGVTIGDLGRVSAEILNAHGLTHPQFNILRILRGTVDSGLTHGALTERMVMGVPDVTRLVDRLVARGLVARQRDPEDRRRVLHTITSAGSRTLDELRPQLADFHTWLSARFSESKRAQVVTLCEELIELAGTYGEEGRDG